MSETKRKTRKGYVLKINHRAYFFSNKADATRALNAIALAEGVDDDKDESNGETYYYFCSHQDPNCSLKANSLVEFQKRPASRSDRWAKEYEEELAAKSTAKKQQARDGEFELYQDPEDPLALPAPREGLPAPRLGLPTTSNS